MKYRSRRILPAVAVAASLGLILAACSGGGDAQKIDAKAPAHLSGTISLWHYFTDREGAAVQSVVNDFEKLNPDVKVVVHSGQDSDKLAKVIASSSGTVDVALMGGTSNVGVLCSSGAFTDLGGYLTRDKVDMSQLTPAGKAFTSYKDDQCALPMLTDGYGLYYNTDILKAAGFTAPPTTLDQLETMALALTKYNPDGSIKSLGFDPLMNFYETTPEKLAPATGATWMKDGKSSISKSPGWAELMTWQKAFVDKIGYAKLKAFTSGLGDEWSAHNAFQTGQVAMMLDGEWRVAFIEDQTPKLHYETAPFPVAADHSELYGSTYTMGTIGGIAKGSKNPEAAWALLKYLTTNTGALVKLANTIKNVPTTTASLNSPELKLPEQFDTFLKEVANPKTVTFPTSAIGEAGLTTMLNYWQQYQSGSGGDLTTGLKKVDTDIDNTLSLSEGP